MLTIQTPTLVIPDMHQHVRWTEAILKKEAKAVESVVFLGDYFDPKVAKAASASETAGFVSSLNSNYSLPITFLVGNHDLPYLYDFRSGDRSANPIANPYTNGAYNTDDSYAISARLSQNFVDSLQPFALAGNRLLSHAGLHSSYWETFPSLDKTPVEAAFAALSQNLRELAEHRSLPLAAVGAARGGIEERGGITWQDWHREFEDSLPYPQIVGHTILSEPAQNGRSWNIDTKAGHYAVVTADEVKIKALAK